MVSNPPNPSLSKGGRGGFLEFVANLHTTSFARDYGIEEREPRRGILGFLLGIRQIFDDGFFIPLEIT
jgi:hypothetical protein